jgi:hypothetical protein
VKSIITSRLSILANGPGAKSVYDPAKANRCGAECLQCSNGTRRAMACQVGGEHSGTCLKEGAITITSGALFGFLAIVAVSIEMPVTDAVFGALARSIGIGARRARASLKILRVL